MLLIPEDAILRFRHSLLHDAAQRAAAAHQLVILLAQVALALALCVAARIWFILPRRAGRTSSSSAGAGGIHRPRGRAAHASAQADETCSLALLLGSGGHTTEMLQLLSALPPQRYASRTYLVSSGDRFSAHKAREHERGMRAAVQTQSQPDSDSAAAPAAEDVVKEEENARIIVLPRARDVHQSVLTTPLTLLRSLLVCLWVVALQPLLFGPSPPLPGAGAKTGQSGRGRRGRMLADVILLNGPGTCVPVVLAVYVLRIFALPSPRLIYVESFARVRHLSLTGKLLRPLVDRFVVQWPQLAAPATAAAGSDAKEESKVTLQVPPCADVECIGWLV
ncbi:glycosyltransferase family 1 protein [Tilletiaria anomala UBC 951]|uniref:UDP-N-acetylglucosamine transferase subunit ALG14 n=1 Tax=Tilletiaria anomala (strain ATCC 24038 / CBS 436.72 / UBC 951) TaxID=1037660 RepID=A0A066WFY9_TILAU|nr:glycosyltransferase family 1 protein [Tilletiaria anomala UBC 951]KDN51438.1 glycosyltransferase family 1 protein [Tilletiaria anomala UBC 951]